MGEIGIMEKCLWCKQSEESYNPYEHLNFLCSRCVQLMLHAPQQLLGDLLWGFEHRKKTFAIFDSTYVDEKIKVLKMFVVGEEKNEQYRPEPNTIYLGTGIDRSRGYEIFRGDKKPIRFDERKRDAIY